MYFKINTDHVSAIISFEQITLVKVYRKISDRKEFSVGFSFKNGDFFPVKFDNLEDAEILLQDVVEGLKHHSKHKD